MWKDLDPSIDAALYPLANQYLYPTDRSSTCSDHSTSENSLSTCNDSPPAIPATQPARKISVQEPTSGALSTMSLLQLRTQELDRLSYQFKKMEHDNDVLKFKINQYKRGHEKIKSALDSHDPRAPGPRYLFDKRLNFFKNQWLFLISSHLKIMEVTASIIACCVDNLKMFASRDFIFNYSLV